MTQAAIPHLTQHHQRWWYSRGIPRHLRATIGKSRFRVNLNTSDLKEALALKPQYDALFLLTINRANRELNGTLNPIEKLETLALALREESLERDPDTGEVELYVDKQQAEKLEAGVPPPLREYFADLVMGRAPKRLKAMVEGYLASVPHLNSRTILERKTTLDTLMRWCSENGVMNVLKFTRSHAKSFIASLKGDASTISKALQAPKALWHYMEDEGLSVDPGIWQSLAPKKSRKAKNIDQERPFTLNELQKLLHSNSRADLKDAMLLSLYSGMRLSEVGDLRVEHVDLTKKIIRIPGTKNQSALRVIPLHKKLVSLLKARMHDKAPREYILHELGDGDLKHGRKRSALVSQAFTRYRESVGVTDDREGKRRSLVNFHSFRRTTTTALVEASVPPDVINAMLGWSGQGSMRSRYSVGADLMLGMREALKSLEWEGL